ncbi:MAG TPA: signal peptide peptidase SppA [Thermoanaerobaculia bacterium]|nr:signal peptide peptidase SppA [Thermoanaerobaculia bacterium]
MSDLDPNETPVAPETPVTAAADQPPVRPVRKGRTFFFGAMTGCLLAVVGAAIFALVIAASRAGTGELQFSTNKVAVVPIEGEIFDARETVDAIHRYADNAMVKAVVVRIDSPGGAIAPSQEIYEEIRKVRASSGKPFVASFDTVAASGGFYIASACDQIVSNPGSITGSIGVILQWLEVKDLVSWAKMRPETITSGGMKDAGSPLRTLTPAERAYFQSIVTQLHGQFVSAVAAGRKDRMTLTEVQAVADGRIFTGQEAHRLKLVDKIGNLDDAVNLAGRLAGIKGKPSMLYPKKRRNELLDLLTDSTDSSAIVERIVTRRLPRFLYRW